MSEGDITKKGWTSTVSFGDVTAFAGIKTGLVWSRGLESLSKMVLTWCLTSGITTTEYRLEVLANAEGTMGVQNERIIPNSQNLLLSSSGNLFENLFSRGIRNMISNHDSLALHDVRGHNLNV
jgi:hypothetical protein